MRVGATRNYKIGQKNNWRRTVWNEVLNRTAGREWVDPILYMPGPQDLDRPVALNKGVPRHNLIAIDYDRANVTKIKADSELAICADVVEVLKAWPSNRRLSAVMLDFCSGLERSFIDENLPAALAKDAVFQSVAMVNFQRGRDSSTNYMRDVYVDHIHPTTGQSMGSAPRDAICCYFKHPSSKCVTDISVSEKNRALHFLIYTISERVGLLLSLDNPKDIDAYFIATADRMLQIMKPTFISYKSGPLTFDSMVFRPFTLKDFEALGWKVNVTSKEFDGMFCPDQSIRRRVAATAAVRTMRLNAS